MCVGNITSADQANTILAAGRADLVALARPHLTSPSFTLQAAAQYGAAEVACRPRYLWGKDALMRNAARERGDARTHAEGAAENPCLGASGGAEGGCGVAAPCTC